MDHPLRLHARWNDLTLPLSALRAWHCPQQSLHDGDLISAVHIVVPYQADDLLFIDDVELVRYVTADAGPSQMP